LEQPDLSSRKVDHIQLAFEAQTQHVDNRFDYEPMLHAHPQEQAIPALQMAGKLLKAPLWISSMTGGAQMAGNINRNLALACKEFGLGMGLGSCRPLLEGNEYFHDFAVRKHIGEQPLFANLGIAQIEELISLGKVEQIRDMVHKLEADGLIVHVNPLQEWLQPEGDTILHPPIDTIKRLLDAVDFPLMVKEVGQGFGPKSLAALAALPLEAIEFGARGGTNFSLLENLRRDEFFREQYEPVARIGHSPIEMLEHAKGLCTAAENKVHARAFIVSGGIQNFLDGYYYVQSLPWKTLYAQASAFLKHAMRSEDELMEFTAAQIKGLSLAYTFLTVKK
jgi:isopentenyl-diphosphate delta-isomerase